MLLSTEKNCLRLELHGREQMWALRAKIEVPREIIKSVRFEPQFQDWRKWEIRMPGASIPGHLVAGSYWTEEGWDFIYIINPRGVYKPIADNVLVIETNQNRYCRILLTSDPEEGEKVMKWWAQKPDETKTAPAKALKAKKPAKQK